MPGHGAWDEFGRNRKAKEESSTEAKTQKDTEVENHL